MLPRGVAIGLAVAASALPAALPAAATAAPVAPLTGRILVSLVHPAAGLREPAGAVHGVTAKTGARLAGPTVPQIGLVVVRPPAGTTLAQLLARLRDDPNVQAAQLEHRATPRLVPNDPALTTQDAASSVPGLTDEWWALRENLPAAWDVTTGHGALVGLIDTGADATHPELAGKIARAQNLDGSGSGDQFTDEDGHGTDVASLACANTNNGIGIAGAGYDCRLLVEKSDFTDASVATAIVNATDAGAQAINMSFGTDGRAVAPVAIVDALRYAYRHNVVLVAAAADSPVTEQGDPANVLQPTGTGPRLNDGMGLSVTAAGPDDHRASFAGFGSQISLAAYGTLNRGISKAGLLGAFPHNLTTREQPGLTSPTGCLCRTTFDGDSRYAYLQGTSLAAPQVTAVGALIRNLNPSLPVSRVLRIMKLTARRPSGAWTGDLGWGILDAGAALRAARGIDATPPTSKVLAPARTRGRTISLHLSGRDAGPRGVYVSGLRSFRVYERRGGGRARLVATTTRRTVRLGVRRDARYTFYARAVDRAGNVEPTPARRARAPRIARVRVL